VGFANNLFGNGNLPKETAEALRSINIKLTLV
jgi:hypothetical protein